MHDISIYCDAGERAGLGHVTRMGHLEQALRDRGAYTELDVGSESDDFKKWRPKYPVVLIDVPNNNDGWLHLLKHLRPSIKLIVFVGVGQSITLRTLWLADLIVYQVVRGAGVLQQWPKEFWPKLMTNQEAIMLDPRIRRGEPKSGAAVYFGAGYSRAYAEAIGAAIGRSPTMRADAIVTNWPRLLAHAEEYVGTMGMAAYDAAAAGCKITVICRTEEHLADAKAAGFSIAGLGEPSIKQIQKARRRAKTCDLIDSAGVYRVAERILELAKT